jgi:hypothetical protein
VISLFLFAGLLIQSLPRFENLGTGVSESFGHLSTEKVVNGREAVILCRRRGQRDTVTGISKPRRPITVTASHSQNHFHASLS